MYIEYMILIERERERKTSDFSKANITYEHYLNVNFIKIFDTMLFKMSFIS